MDPTAPKNSKNQQFNSPGVQSSQPNNPIEPGQFVVAQDEPQNSQMPPLNPPPQSPPGGVQADDPPQMEAASKAPSFSLAGQRSSSPQDPLQPPSAPPPNQSQPDPAPFSPSADSSNTQEVPPQQGEKKSGAMKMIVMVLIILALVGIIAAVVWFFVLPRTKGKSAKVENTSQEQVEEPSPATKAPAGGFSELPEATPEATNSGVTIP